jgi:hypothetical protein
MLRALHNQLLLRLIALTSPYCHCLFLLQDRSLSFGQRKELERRERREDKESIVFGVGIIMKSMTKIQSIE